MSARDSIDRLFDSITDRHETAFENIRSANDRYHRLSRSLIEGARKSVHDWTNVARGWTQRPTDIMGLYEAMSEAVANDQARRLALWQEFLEDLVETQRESREVVRRGFGEAREAVERVRETVPSFLRARVPSFRRNETEPEPVAETQS